MVFPILVSMQNDAFTCCAVNYSLLRCFPLVIERLAPYLPTVTHTSRSSHSITGLLEFFRV